MNDFEVLISSVCPSRVVSPRKVLYHLLKKNGVSCCKEEFGFRSEPKGGLLPKYPPSSTSSNDSYHS